ncbi:MAG TPA: hypothetical protein VMO47_09245 [Rhodothermales bacterium]|nr:hypothetical protein [Rhodothermales bacterium]
MSFLRAVPAITFNVSVLTRILFLVLIASGLLVPSPSLGQMDATHTPSRSPGKALALSLLVPGLGHRYANGGHWGKSGSFFLAADVGILVNLLAARWREDDLEKSYRTLAASQAGAEMTGKTRAFFLSLGSYNSSNEFKDVLLRTRQWDRIESAEDPANYWDWESEADRLDYRELREDADGMGRRASWLIGGLVANRVISGVTAMLRARNSGGADVSAHVAPDPVSGGMVGTVAVRF